MPIVTKSYRSKKRNSLFSVCDTPFSDEEVFNNYMSYFDTDILHDNSNYCFKVTYGQSYLLELSNIAGLEQDLPSITILCASEAYISLDSPNDNSYVRYSFDETTTEFKLDSCASTHICNDISMFLTESLVDLTNIGVGGIGRVSLIEKKGMIRFNIVDEESIQEDILLTNVCYMRTSPHNLISISQWDENRNDNPLLLCRGKYSWFVWHNLHHKN